jgi:hypothetical protein
MLQIRRQRFARTFNQPIERLRGDMPFSDYLVPNHGAKMLNSLGSDFTHSNPTHFVDGVCSEGPSLKQTNTGYLQRSIPFAQSGPRTICLTVLLNSASNITPLYSIGSSTVDNAPKALIRLEANGTIMVYNGGAYSITTAAGAFVFGVTQTLILAMDSLAASANQIYKLAINGKVYTGSTRPGAVDKTTEYIGMGYTGVNYPQGHFINFWAAPVYLSDKELETLSANPYEIFKNQSAPVFNFTAGGSAALEGGASAVVSSQAALSTAIPVNGAAAIIANASGNLTTETRLNAGATGSSSATGVLDTAVNASGNAAGTVSAQANLNTQIPVQAAALIVAGAAGEMSTSTQLNAAAQSIALTVAALNSAIDMVGGAQLQQHAGGNLSVGDGLSGDAAMSASANGALSTELRISASAVLQALTNAGIDTQILMAAIAQAQSSTSGSMTVGSSLTGSAHSEALSQASITVSLQLSAAAVMQALANASLQSGAGMEGEAAMAVSASGALSAFSQLAGLAASVSTANGDLVVKWYQLDMAGHAIDQTHAAATITTDITFNAAAFLQSYAAASLGFALGFMLASIKTEPALYGTVGINRAH